MKLTLSSGPHIHSGTSVRRTMIDVLIALAPAAIMACVLFSMRALFVIAVTVASAVGAEALFCLATKKKQTVGDLSACVTGLILALNLPYTVPLWQAAIGGVISTVFVKMLFGGIGENFANPAATARVILLVSFPGTLGAWTATRFMPDAVSGPTPLALLASGDADALPSLFSMLWGNRGGAMGETCIIAILVGLLYLLLRRVITAHAPIAFILSVFVFSWIAYGSPVLALYGVLSGGLVFGAVFMATDYTTTPMTPWGKIIFGVGCGIITSVIRIYCDLPGGVSYSILLMNLLTPYIEKLTMPRALGGAKE